MTFPWGQPAFLVRHRFDWPLFIVSSLIAVVGIVNLYSATSVGSISRSELYLNQVYWLVAGGILAVVVASVDYRHIEQAAYLLYGVGLALLVLVLVLGRDIRGSARWINIGSFGFQPSEFMKLFLTIALARFVHDDPRSERRTVRELFGPAVLTLVPVLLVLRQPDLGTALILSLIFAAVVGLLRIQPKTLAFLGLCALVALPLAWQFGLQDYQRRRITAFIDPEADIQGAGWHAYHAIVAIGNGGVLGQGYMQGTQNQYLFIPDQYSDFPFPVFAEEWGFVGSLVLLGLYGFLTLWSVRIAAQARDRFGAVTAIGVGAMVFWHTVFNLGMVVGLLPVVGVPLPLFSYGGSSVVTILIGVGLLMNVSIRRYSSGITQVPYQRL